MAIQLAVLGTNNSGISLPNCVDGGAEMPRSYVASRLEASYIGENLPNGTFSITIRVYVNGSDSGISMPITFTSTVNLAHTGLDINLSLARSDVLSLVFEYEDTQSGDITFVASILGY